MASQDMISASEYRKIVFQHSYFLLSRAIESFELEYYNLAVFFAIASIEEITNNLYSLTEKFENFSIINFMDDFFPLTQGILKGDIEYTEEIGSKLTEIFEKYFKEVQTPSKLSLKDLSSQFRMKEHKSHNKKTLTALIHSLSINPEAYRKLGSGFVDMYLFFAERGLIFELRNSCLYVKIKNNVVSDPEETIPKNMAIDFIAIAFESLIQLKDFGRNFHSKKVPLLDEVNLRKKADKFYKENNLKPIKYVGTITDFLNKKNVIIVDVQNEVSLNDDLVIYNSQWKHLDKALSMEKNHKKITKAVSGDKVGIEIQNKTLRKGFLYKVQDDVALIQRKGTIQLGELYIKARKIGQLPDKEKVAELLNKSLKGVS
jgi:AbiV family abortive infection protein